MEGVAVDETSGGAFGTKTKAMMVAAQISAISIKPSLSDRSVTCCFSAPPGVVIAVATGSPVLVMPLEKLDMPTKKNPKAQSIFELTLN